MREGKIVYYKREMETRHCYKKLGMPRGVRPAY